MKKVWRIWAKALGDKSGKSDKEADYVAIIRTFIFLQLIITNCFIVGGNMTKLTRANSTGRMSKVIEIEYNIINQ